eukprot:4362689-Prorocentrum_lima.AAC.1
MHHACLRACARVCVCGAVLCTPWSPAPAPVGGSHPWIIHACDTVPDTVSTSWRIHQSINPSGRVRQPLLSPWTPGPGRLWRAVSAPLLGPPAQLPGGATQCPRLIRMLADGPLARCRRDAHGPGGLRLF